MKLDAFAKKRFFLISMVFLDLFAVGLVIPLFPRVIKNLGLDVHKIGYMTSVYQASQIFGCLILGSLSDTIGRKAVLLLNFAGAGVAYFIVGIATEWRHLLLSRLLVGLVKQTETFSRALMVDLTTVKNRAEWLGRISASVTLAFLLAQSIGGKIAVLYSIKTTILIACTLYTFNFIVFGLFFSEPESASRNAKDLKPQTKARTIGGTFREFMNNFYILIRDPGIRGFFCLYAVTKVWEKGNRTLAWTYEVDRFQFEPDTIGYFGSYKKALMIVANSTIITMVKSCAKEQVVLKILVAIILASAAVELSNLPVWMYILQTSISMIAITALNTFIMTQLLDRIPNERRGACLGALDVFSSTTGVLCPILIGYLPVPSSMRSPYWTFGCYCLMAVSLQFIMRDGEIAGDQEKLSVGLDKGSKKLL